MWSCNHNTSVLKMVMRTQNQRRIDLILERKFCSSHTPANKRGMLTLTKCRIIMTNDSLLLQGLRTTAHPTCRLPSHGSSMRNWHAEAKMAMVSVPHNELRVEHFLTTCRSNPRVIMQENDFLSTEYRNPLLRTSSLRCRRPWSLDTWLSYGIGSATGSTLHTSASPIRMQTFMSLTTYTHFRCAISSDKFHINAHAFHQRTDLAHVHHRRFHCRRLRGFFLR